jgi:quercetin dioxygenase-like cupin family protein
VRFLPWPEGGEPPTERMVRAQVSTSAVAPYVWGSPPGHRYQAHQHAYFKMIVCLQGSIEFTLSASGARYTLRPGDRLDLPRMTTHSAAVGPEGVVCLEGHRGR